MTKIEKIISKPMETKKGITIKINTDNSAFDYGNERAEICRILNDFISKYSNGHNVNLLKDVNGNTIGEVFYFMNNG